MVRVSDLLLVTGGKQSQLLVLGLRLDFAMSLVNETETCHALVLPARPRPRLIAPWVHKQKQRPRLRERQSWSQD